MLSRTKGLRWLILFLVLISSTMGQDDKTTVAVYQVTASIDIANGDKTNAVYEVQVSDDTDLGNCPPTTVKVCLLAIIKSYTVGDEKQQVDPKTSTAQLGFISATQFAVTTAPEADFSFTSLFDHLAEKLNPLTDASQAATPQFNPFAQGDQFPQGTQFPNLRNNQADRKTDQPCQKQICLPDTEATRSQYKATSQRDQNGLLNKHQKYNVILRSEDNEDQDGNQINTSLEGEVNFDIQRTNLRQRNLRLLARYRDTLENGNTRTNEDIDRQRQESVKLVEEDDDTDPCFDSLEKIEDLKQPLEIDRYFQDHTEYQKRFAEQIRQEQETSVTTTVNDIFPEVDVQDAVTTTARFLQTSTSHRLFDYTRTLYRKVILGRVVQVRIVAQCSLIVSSNPVRHEVECRTQLIYRIFGPQRVKTIYQFRRQVGLNWNWNRNYGGLWCISFGIRLPPPVSFISINFKIRITYYINIQLEGRITRWWYPFIYRTRAVITTGLDTYARATLRIIAIQGGVYISGTLVRVRTDPTASLYYYFLPTHRFIIVLVCWYYEILAFRFQWGFLWRYWFFGWKRWRIIAKWNIAGIYRRYKIVYRAFFLRL